MAFRPEEESDYTSSSEEESEDEEIIKERERDEDYERMEIAMQNWPPPPCLAFMENMSVVDIRCCIFSDKKYLLEEVMDSSTSYSWNKYHLYKEKTHCQNAMFQYEDWETMGEYIMYLSEKCLQEFNWFTVLRILSYGNFVKLAPRPFLPKIRN